MLLSQKAVNFATMNRYFETQQDEAPAKLSTPPNIRS